MVTAVTAGMPWHLVRPMLRGDGRLLMLGYAVLYRHHLPWPGDRPGYAVLALLTHSRTLHGHVPRGRVRVLRSGIGGLL